MRCYGVTVTPLAVIVHYVQRLRQLCAVMGVVHGVEVHEHQTPSDYYVRAAYRLCALWLARHHVREVE